MIYPTTVHEAPSLAAESDADDDLAHQARCNPEAFGELYRRHLPKIYRYHLARTGDPQDAQDLAAQTFLAALERISSYQAYGSFGGWLFGIASHKVADHFRQQRAHLPLESAEDLPHPGPLPEEATFQNVQFDQVARSLRKINPERAEAVTLRIAGGLSADEVGQVMGKSEAAAKMLVHRGLQELKEKLMPQKVNR